VCPRGGQGLEKRREEKVRSGAVGEWHSSKTKPREREVQEKYVADKRPTGIRMGEKRIVLLFFLFWPEKLVVLGSTVNTSETTFQKAF